MATDIDILTLIEKRLGALEQKLEAAVDRELTGQVRRALAIARVDPAFVLAKARYVLEVIIHDIYRRELPEAKPKPLFNMIEVLAERPGLFDRKTLADIHYIRIHGNLLVHVQDEPPMISDGNVEQIMLMTANLVDWYLLHYQPAREEGRAALMPDLPIPPNPYRGLEAFGEADSANYFGRDVDIEELCAAVARQPLVAVVGPSGSGKSSLALAGVASCLRAQGDWAIAVCRPSSRPFSNLAHALVGLWETDQTAWLNAAGTLAKAMADGSVELIDAIRPALGEQQPRLLLVLDQYEELYTLVTDASLSAAFSDFMVQALNPSGASGGADASETTLCVLLTLRVDFLGQALGHRGLAAALDRYPMKLLGPIGDPERLREIIERPAQQAGVALEPLLAECLLRDLGRLDVADEEQAPSLPLLEFTLTELWHRQVQLRLTHVAYAELGGVASALARHADAVYADCTAGEQSILRHLFIQMVRPGKGTEDTRQVATRGQFSPEQWRLIVKLANKRLVVTGHDAASDEDTAELIHEALLHHWQLLRDWVREDHGFRLWQMTLREHLGDWRSSGEDPEVLLAGARLATAEERLASDSERLTEAEKDYIQLSLTRREVLQRDRERLRRRILYGLIGFLVIALMLSALAGWQWRVAALQTRVAELSRSRADEQLLVASRHLARAHEEKAIGILNRPTESLSTRDYQAALLHALAAQRLPLRGAPGLTTDGLASLDEAPLDQAFAQRWISPSPDLNGGVHAVTFGPEGRLVAGASDDGTVRLWNRETGATLHILRGHENTVNALAFSPHGHLIASGSSDRTVRLWDPASGAALRTLIGHKESVEAVAFSPDGRLLSSVAIDETSRLWRAATGEALHTPSAHEYDQRSDAIWDPQTGMPLRIPSGHRSSARARAFSPVRRLLASARDRTVFLSDLNTTERQRILTGHEDLINALAFSPDGRLLASASGRTGESDNTVRLWDPETGDVMGTLRGHEDYVYDVAFSPDGQLLASASRDRTVRLWNPKRGEALRTYESRVNAVAFSADGRLLASATRDGVVRILNPETGEELHTLSGHESSVNAVAFSPDGRQLASASDDGTVRLWNCDTWKALSKLTGHQSAINAVAFSSDGRQLASASDDGTVRLWDPENGVTRRTLKGHHSSGTAVNAVAFSPDGRFLASASDDGTVRLSDPETGRTLRTLRGDHDGVHAVAFSPDGRLLASASGVGMNRSDSAVRLWDPESGEALQTLRGHVDDVFAVAFSPDGQLLAGASNDGTVRLWDPMTGAMLSTLRGHTSAVHSVAFSSDGRLLASGSYDRTVRLWDRVTGAARQRLSGEGSRFRFSTVAFSPDGQRLASASDNRTVHLWDPKTGETIHTLSGNEHPVKAVAFSMDGRLIAGASDDGALSEWDAATGEMRRTLIGHETSDDGTRSERHRENQKMLRELNHHEHGVMAVAFSSDRRLLAIAHQRYLRLWDSKTGEMLQTLSGHERSLYSAVAFSPDDRLLASASGDGHIPLWDPKTGEMLRTLSGHESQWYSAVAFSPDGRLLASGSVNGSVHLWNPMTGDLLRTLQGHDSPISAVAFSPDGRLLASGSFHGSVRLWDSKTGEAQRRLSAHGLSEVKALAFSPDQRFLASAHQGAVRLWDLRLAQLLRNASAPSPRAALISEALQRLWGLRVDGLDVVRETWNNLLPREGYQTDQLITIDARTLSETADSTSQPLMRTFDLRPLLDPPLPDQDKLDQFLDWLTEQERLELRLAP